MDTISRRKRILVSAYSCNPEEGSEPGAGWMMVASAARQHRVWLLTRPCERAAIERALEANPQLSEAIAPVYLSLPLGLDRRLRRTADFYWHYPWWQLLAGRLAVQLHEKVRFDVLHHVTFAADWQYVGLTRVRDVPLVWGPVGGATYPPMRLIRSVMTSRQTAYEVLRSVATRFFRRTFGDAVARRAGLVVVMNNDSAKRFARYAITREVNACIDLGLGPVTHSTHVRRFLAVPGPRAVYVGRLIPLKGIALAIRALVKDGGKEWSLCLVGEGPEEERLREEATRLGLFERVHFFGRIPRSEVLAILGEADCLVFPSLHDTAPWAVAEAVTLGCPVLCLDLGGPPMMMAGHGVAVPPRGDVPSGLAQGLRDIPPRNSGTEIYRASRMPNVVAGWYDQVSDEPCR